MFNPHSLLSTATHGKDLAKPATQEFPLREKSACGVGGIVDLKQRASKDLVNLVLSGLCDMDMRTGRIGDDGDGAGATFRTAGLRRFFEAYLTPGKHVPESEPLLAGNFFFPPEDPLNTEEYQRQLEAIMRREGLMPLNWRKIPVDEDALGPRARGKQEVWQLLFGRGSRNEKGAKEALYRAKINAQAALPNVDTVSLQWGTITYKHMCRTDKFQRIFINDFNHPDFQSDAGTFHGRYSTVTTSGAAKAQPFRLIAHNGEINPIAAIRDATRNIEGALRLKHSILAGPGASDSMDTDRLVELFTSHGVPLDETLRRFFLPAIDDQRRRPKEEQKFFLAVKRALGTLSAFGDPAAIVALDDQMMVSILGSMGVRPMRAMKTRSGLFIFSSEVGVPHTTMEDREWVYQLDAGEMIAVEGSEIRLPNSANQTIVSRTQLNVAELTSPRTIYFLPKIAAEQEPVDKQKLVSMLNLFGFDRDRLELLRDMMRLGTEPTQGMSSSKPLPLFSQSHPPLSAYIFQSMPDITNPPFDPIREGNAFDLGHFLGRTPAIVEHGFSYKPFPQYKIHQTVLDEEEFAGLIQEGTKDNIPVEVLDTAFQGKNVTSFIEAVERIKEEVIRIARLKRAAVIVLSDRGAGEDSKLYIPPVLLVPLLHNELVNQGLRREVKLVCDTGEVLEPHDAAVLFGFGADAVNPYLLWKLIHSDLIPLSRGENGDSSHENRKKQIVNALKVMMKKFLSKAGVVSFDGYHAARFFRIFGIDPEVTNYFMPGTDSPVGGLRLEDIFDDLVWRSQLGGKDIKRVRDVGEYPEPLRRALEAVGFRPDDPWAAPDPQAYERFSVMLDAQPPVFLRDCLDFDFEGATPVLPTMTPEEFIEQGFLIGAGMSHGALFRAAHRAIARAFNRLRGKSNCGEGGEDPSRYKGGKDEQDRSRIKQIGTARFGVDLWYLADADEIEIKFSQGVKPREGGDLLGEESAVADDGTIIVKKRGKVTAEIAFIRHVQPGQRLTSPPPQISVFSIEDLQDFIGAIRSVNPYCQISVKIAPSPDVGSVAVGVAKGGADTLSVSGVFSKTGAAQYSSIHHTGGPSEIGTAEIHQALTAKGLRDFMDVRADEGVKSGAHIVKMMLLGASEVAEGQSLLIAGERCIDCKECPDGSACPSGICHQDDTAALRLGADKKKKLQLAPTLDEAHEEQIIERCADALCVYLLAQAREAIDIFAKLGFQDPRDAIGRVDKLKKKVFEDNRGSKLFDPGLLLRDMRPFTPSQMETAMHESIEHALRPDPINTANNVLIEVAKKMNGSTSRISGFSLRPQDRHFGSALAGEIARKTITPPHEGFSIETTGDGGQRYGFAIPPSMKLRHTGFLNDYVGEALSGGEIVAVPPKEAGVGSENSLVGNACCLGAIAGTFYAAGRAGQRLGARNSGATIVALGCGKYPLEYMTEGTAVLMGKIGHDLGSGMTGGEAFVMDEDRNLQEKLHQGSVKIVPMGRADEVKLHGILLDFLKKTDSPEARLILGDWENEKMKFQKVISTFQSSYTIQRDRERISTEAAVS